jgi:lipoprotein NlpD
MKLGEAAKRAAPWGPMAQVRGKGAGALLAVALFTGACSQTPLDTAPIVDLSRAHGTDVGTVPPGTAAEGGDVYVVQKGDTLFHIAMTNHVGLRDLARWNGLDETAPLQIGQRLRLREAAAAPAAASGETGGAAAAPEEAAAPAQAHAIAVPSGPQLASRPLESVVAPAPIVAAPPAAAGAGQAAAAAAPARAAASAWVWPIEGRVVTPFDPGKSKGIDIAAEEDAPVRAATDGQVSYTGSPPEYGNLVILTHADGVRTVYAHNKTILARQGDTVSRGQVIATAGHTSAPLAALHFEVRLKGVPVNPLDYLPPR